MKRAYIENICKNIILIVLLWGFYYPVRAFLAQLRTEDYDAILIVSTLLIMAFLFADYAFTYSGLSAKMVDRYIGHVITFLIMFGSGALLEITVISLDLRIEKTFILFRFLAVIFYSSLVIHDFWDLKRVVNP